jgi:hypothetical protein
MCGTATVRAQIVSDFCAKEGNQQHTKARIATATADSFADENSTCKGRSVPVQQHASGGNSNLMQVAPLGLYGAPATTLLGHTQLPASPYCGAAAGQ